jgi:hypothetical protein
MLPNTDRAALQGVLDLIKIRETRGEQGDLDPELWETEQLYLARVYLEGAPKISGNGN